MKKLYTLFAVSLGFTIALSTLFPSPVFAQDTNPSTIDQSTAQTQLLIPNQQSYDRLPTPSVLPDSPFYFLKRWGENITTFFTIDDYTRAQYQLHLAQVRLAEAKAELQKNNADLTDKMLDDYNKDIQSISATTQKLSEEGKEVTRLIDTIKDREETRLTVLNHELAHTDDPTKKQKIQNAIHFTSLQSQTNINRLVNTITHTPTYQPSANQTLAGQITSINTPNFTLITPNNKIFTFSSDASTVVKQYGSSGSASLGAMTVGTFVRITFPRVNTGVSGTPTSLPTPTSPIVLAKEIVIGVPQSLIIPLVGTIANFASNSFTLQTTTGATLTIRVNMSTIYHGNRSDATAESIHDGTHVRIYAVPQSTTNTYLARIIYVELPQKHSQTGTIITMSGTTITIASKNNKTYTFTLTSDTVVQKNGQPDSSSDLSLNELVTVWYMGEVTQTNANATDINIHTPRTRAKNVSPLPSGTPTITPTPTNL